MTTDLALDFAREVIGWIDAAPHHSGEYSIRQFAHQSGGRFYHSSLDDVILWVSNWCDEHDRQFKLIYGQPSEIDAADYTAVVAGFDSTSSDPKFALMEACLKAERDRAQDHAVMP